MNPEVSPYVLVSAFVTQQIYGYLYRHPDVKWVNKGTVLELSAATSAALAVVTAWASGALNQDVVHVAVDAVWNAVVGAFAPIAMHEITKLWSMVKPSFVDRLNGVEIAPKETTTPSEE